MFRNEYIGTAPYISCSPSICHHRLCPRDQFLILSSDGLYQYLSNQEVVSLVESFMEKFPDGDPAQHLIEELLFRAAKKAGKHRFYNFLHISTTLCIMLVDCHLWMNFRKCLFFFKLNNYKWWLTQKIDSSQFISVYLTCWLFFFRDWILSWVGFLQAWISMNYWTSRKGIEESTMMMLLSWWYRWREEFGSHQESTYETLHMLDSHQAISLHQETEISEV